MITQKNELISINDCLRDYSVNNKATFEGETPYSKSLKMKLNSTADSEILFEDLAELLLIPTKNHIQNDKGCELTKDSKISISQISCNFSIFSASGIFSLNGALIDLISKLGGYEANGQPDPIQLAIMNVCSDKLITKDVYEDFELGRQTDKFISNSIGSINENIVALIPGARRVSSAQSALDVHIYDDSGKEVVALIEVKNRYNTMNAGGRVKVYQDMSELVTLKQSKYFNKTAILAIRIPSSVGVQNYTPSNNRTGRRFPIDDRIKEMDFGTLMTLYTGDPFAYLRAYFLVLVILSFHNIISDEADIMYYLETFVKSNKLQN
jgi:hypothetical protein